jgi:acyl carrier protein
MSTHENIKKYNKAFTDTFMIDELQLDSLEYQSINEWDSVGHMSLMAVLEEIFQIEMDTDDIIDFSSYAKGKEIMSKYHVKF